MMTIAKPITFEESLLVRREPLTYRVPDVSVYRREGYRHYVFSTPELIIEVVSPTNRKGNLEELLRNYASIAVPEQAQ